MNGKLKVTTLSPEEIRYTGKPYSEALRAYVFTYRNYSPETNRWTTPDTKGFPDGANNRCYVNNVVTYALDSEGANIYYNNGNNGDHCSITVTNPNSPTGYTSYSYAPASGTGYNDYTNVITAGTLYTNASAPSAGDLMIPTSAAQDAAANATAASIGANPGTYNYFTNNCADITQNIINSALPTSDQLFHPVFDSPDSLNNYIRLYLHMGLE
jgi:RHS repeat-associated protein